MQFRDSLCANSQFSADRCVCYAVDKSDALLRPCTSLSYIHAVRAVNKEFSVCKGSEASQEHVCS